MLKQPRSAGALVDEAVSAFLRRATHQNALELRNESIPKAANSHYGSRESSQCNPHSLVSGP